MSGYAVFHEMDYSDKHLERGEFIELEVGAFKNDNSLLAIGYIKEHDGKNLLPCLRCVKKFVSDLFLRNHEESCPMQEVTLPEEAGAPTADPPSETETNPSELSIPEQIQQLATAQTT